MTKKPQQLARTVRQLEQRITDADIAAQIGRLDQVKQALQLVEAQLGKGAASEVLEVAIIIAGRKLDVMQTTKERQERELASGELTPAPR